MMKTVAKYTLPAALLAGGLYVSQMNSFATPAYAKKEGGAKCTVCHTAMGKKDLNDVGKCYKGKNHTDLKSCETK
ncbi:MAG: hypothetical protein JSU00_21980 [Acidobacteria bacterium]|nr:hypothetical protein [Acidobacteriota bacterium]